MSNTLRYGIAIVVGIFLIIIFNLIRKNKLNMKYALLWIVLSILMVIALLIPDFLFKLSNLLGFEVMSNMLYLIAILVLLLICISLTIFISKQSSMITLLTQEVSMLKSKIKEEDKQEK